jgi:hypothetical protein
VGRSWPTPPARCQAASEACIVLRGVGCFRTVAPMPMLGPRVRRRCGSFGGSGTHLPRVRRPEPPLSTTTPQVIILLGYSGHSRCRGVPHKREIRARTHMGGRRPSHTRNIRAHSSDGEGGAAPCTILGPQAPRRARFCLEQVSRVRFLSARESPPCTIAGCFCTRRGGWGA